MEGFKRHDSVQGYLFMLDEDDEDKTLKGFNKRLTNTTLAGALRFFSSLRLYHNQKCSCINRMCEISYKDNNKTAT